MRDGQPMTMLREKGDRRVGVGWQHAEITGQVENCQTVVFAAYVTARAHRLFDFRLYLSKAWCADRARREQAHVPDDARQGAQHAREREHPRHQPQAGRESISSSAPVADRTRRTARTSA